MLKATVSGSFHRHMPAIYAAVGELRAAGVDVLSPSDPRVVDHMGEFLFVASDKIRSIKLVQDRHFAAIKASDFLWIVCPDGYTGPSASSEIGAAHALGTPIFSDHVPSDVTLQHYVRLAPSIKSVVKFLQSAAHQKTKASTSLLLDPEHFTVTAIRAIEDLRNILTGKDASHRDIDDAVTKRVDVLKRNIGIPEIQ